MCFYTYLIYNLIFYKYSSTITIKYKLHLPIYHPNNSQNTLYKDISEFKSVTLTEKTMDLKLFHINYTRTYTYLSDTNTAVATENYLPPSKSQMNSTENVNSTHTRQRQRERFLS